MAHGWLTLKKYSVSDRVTIFVKYKRFEKYKGFEEKQEEFVGDRRIEILDGQIGQRQSVDNRYIARSIRLLIDRYDLKPRYERGDSVPIEIALDGKPSVAIYLCGALGYSTAEAAERMDVTEDTIQKYILRFEEQPYWSSDPDSKTRFETG